jgi:sulfur carrier protein ThiS
MDTIEIHIQFRGLIADLAGVSETRETVPKGTKLGDLVRRLADRLEPGFGRLVLDKNREVHPGVMIVSGGRVVPPARLSDWRLEEGDSVEICTLVAGG